MRRFFFCLVIAGFTLSGCSWQKQPDSETKLFRDFSLAEIVERVHASELKPGPSGSGWSGSSEFSSSPGIRRRGFTLIYTIEEREGTKFDEDSFIKKLYVESQRVTDEAGMQMNGSGMSYDHFNFDYSTEDNEGWVEVIGTRVEGNQYKLWAMIRESTKGAKK
jgi:hypothetical protein